MSSHGGFSDTDCARLASNLPTEIVAFSGDSSIFDSSMVSWSPTDPLSFTVNGTAVHQAGISGEIQISVLQRHDNNFLHLLTKPLSVIDCIQTLTIDEAALPSIASIDSPSSGTVVAILEIEPLLHESLGLAFEVEKRLKFVFK